MILSATGHRPDKLGGYGYKEKHRLIKFAIQEIRKLNPDKIISGMALGWDMAVAEAAYLLNIPYIAAIPFIGQEKLWPPKSKDEYNFLVTNSCEFVIVCKGGYHPGKMQARNIWMVDNSDKVLALFDGSNDGSNGGTKNCIMYAGKDKVINVWDEWERFNESNT
jgi:uncharacterized phage-like protein YoqJ